jgi:hypothetical protein
MTYIYVGSPYSDRSPTIREARYHAVMDYVDWVIKNTDYIPYSPIMHFHPFTERCGHPGDAAYWAYHNFAMLQSARQLHVLNIDAAKDSKGLAGEIAQAYAQKIGLWLATPGSEKGEYSLVQTNLQELASELR